MLPDVPPDMLGARLTAWLGGRVEGALQLSLSDGEGESVAEVAAENGLPTMTSLATMGGCIGEYERSVVPLTVIEDLGWKMVWRVLASRGGLSEPSGPSLSL